LSLTTPAPAAAATAAAAAAAAANADANANADNDADAAPPLPAVATTPLASNAIFASPPPCLSLRRRRRLLPLTPQAPLNPVFIVHRHHLVLCGTILCHVGNLFCLKLQQI
jgi:hypothetical protein